MKPTGARIAFVLSAALLFAAVLACNGGAKPSTPASAEPAPTQAGSGAGGSIQDISDPCHLLDATDASKLFGHSA
jgi:hypothetical protein